MKRTRKRSSVKFSKNVSDFITEVRGKTKQHGFKVRFVDDEYVYGEKDDDTPHVSKLTGYFDYDEGVNEIVVAIGRPLDNWVSTLAHEYAHFLQWLDRPDLYADEDVDDRFDDWLMLKREYKSDKELWADLKVIRESELDAEMRTVALLRKHQLIKDIDDYIKMANAYILSYNIMAMLRKIFFPAAYKVEAVWSQMPSNFNLDYAKDHMKYYALFMKHCTLYRRIL